MTDDELKKLILPFDDPLTPMAHFPDQVRFKGHQLLEIAEMVGPGLLAAIQRGMLRTAFGSNPATNRTAFNDLLVLTDEGRDFCGLPRFAKPVPVEKPLPVVAKKTKQAEPPKPKPVARSLFD